LYVNPSRTPPPRVLSRREVVLPLVEEEAGLLSLPEVRLEDDVAFADGDDVGHLALQQGHALVEPLEEADTRIVALEDALRIEPLREDPHDLVLETLGGLREGLDDEVVAVAIHHERGQAVPLGMDESAGGRPPGQRLAPADGGLELLLEEAGRQCSPLSIMRSVISERDE
jgi:hypothetical protein